MQVLWLNGHQTNCLRDPKVTTNGIRTSKNMIQIVYVLPMALGLNCNDFT